MTRGDLHVLATRAGERFVKDHGINTLPVLPILLAQSLGIEVKPNASCGAGVSGMLLRSGNQFGIAYSTFIDNIGYQHFSVGHELGHFVLPGHIDAVLGNGTVHQSRAGFSSGNRFELEADHFAAGLLMPNYLFSAALEVVDEGLGAILRLSDLCLTSLTATAIRFVQCTPEPVAIVVSNSDQIDYCFMSATLRALEGLDWLRKRAILPKCTATHKFNRVKRRVRYAERAEGTSDLRDWFGGAYSLEVTEEVIGLGQYGKTLTVLTVRELPDPEEIEEEKSLIESWQPRFRG